MQQARRQPLGDRRVTVAPDQRELVAAEPRHGAAIVLEGCEALADRHQDLVARPVPEAVVDLLESVEVEVDDGKCPAGGGARGELPGAREERGAVGELRQRVAVGEPVRMAMRPVVLDGDGAERHADVGDHALERAVAVAAPAVEAESPGGRTVRNEDRTRSATHQALGQDQMAHIVEKRIGGDVRDLDLLPPVDRGPAGSGAWPDGVAVEGTAICGRERGAGQRPEPSVVDCEHRARDRRQQVFDPPAQEVHGIGQRLSRGNRPEHLALKDQKLALERFPGHEWATPRRRKFMSTLDAFTRQNSSIQ